MRAIPNQKLVQKLILVCLLILMMREDLDEACFGKSKLSDKNKKHKTV